MPRYRIAGQSVDSDDPQFATLLGEVYGTKNRPLCVCREPGVEMYIAKVFGKLLIKRMPDSGGNHAPACDSYEPPLRLSGLGQVMGTAIQENLENGITTLKLDFLLTKRASRAAPVPSGMETDSVKPDGNKLTLRGTLNFLWDQAGFNRWSSAMRGKRNWFVIRKISHQRSGKQDCQRIGIGGYFVYTRVLQRRQERRNSGASCCPHDDGGDSTKGRAPPDAGDR